MLVTSLFVGKKIYTFYVVEFSLHLRYFDWHFGYLCGSAIPLDMTHLLYVGVSPYLAASTSGRAEAVQLSVGDQTA